MSFLPSDFVTKMDKLNEEIINIHSNIKGAVDTTMFYKRVDIIISSLSARLVKPGHRVDGESVCLIHAGLRKPGYARCRPYPVKAGGLVNPEVIQKVTADLLVIQQKIEEKKQPHISTLITFLSAFSKCAVPLQDGYFLVNINTNNVEIDSDFNNVLIKQIKLSYTAWYHLATSFGNDKTQLISRDGFDLEEFCALYEEPVYTKLLDTLKQIEQHTAEQAAERTAARDKLLEDYSEHLLTSLL